MRRQTLFGIGVCSLILALTASVLVSDASLNARAIQWQEKPQVIHIVAWDDEGRFDVPAVVDVGQPLLFLFEWLSGSIAEAETFIGDPEHTFVVSVNGGPSYSVKEWYQAPFEAVPMSGPRWTWDHDGDGPGDGDGDGVTDWSGVIVFFRYPYGGLAEGTHTFEFTVTYNSGEGYYTTVVDTITVEVVDLAD